MTRAPMRLSNRWRSWLAATASLALGACSVVTSESLNGPLNTLPEAHGVYYALPMGLIDITLSVEPDLGHFRLDFGVEKYVADPRQRFVMQYKPLPNYSDIVEIKVNNRSLISSVDATTEDQTGNIIVELAKIFHGFGGLQSAPVPNGYVAISTVTIDASDTAKLAEAAEFLNRRARVFAQAKREVACNGLTEEQITAEIHRACALYTRLMRPKLRLVKLGVEAPPPIQVTKPADCTVGLCYRVKEPYIIRYAVDGAPGTQLVYLPNKAPLIELDVRRALLVQKIQKIVFDNNGFLQSASVKKDSELLAASMIPLNILTAVSTALPIRLTIQQKQVEAAQKQLALVEAQQSLAEAAGATPAKPKVDNQ